MKLSDTGLMPVSPTLRKPLATVCLVACCCLSEATVVRSAGQVFRASYKRSDSEQIQPQLHQNTSDATTKAPLVKHQHVFEPFGSPRYPDEQPELTWADLSGHIRGKLGHVCEPGGPSKQCGDALVCRESVCRHCLSDRECASVHHCLKTFDGDNVCVPKAKKAWEEVGSDPYHFLCSLLIFFSSVLAAAAGTGGGGMFVPLLVLFAALKADSAVPLSQCMIFFSSLCNIIAFVGQRHTQAAFKAQPKIDYDCIVLFEPMLVLGVTFGVLLHRMSPQWFLLSLLCVTLGMALQRTASKGFKQREQETAKQKGQAHQITPEVERPSWSDWISTIAEITRPKSLHLMGIFVIWLIMFCASFHGLSACDWHFGILFAVLSAALAIVTVVAAKFIIARPEKHEKPLDWLHPDHNALGVFTYPGIAFIGGLLGGLLGLGGGIVMSPVLLALDMHSESVQATTAVIVFLSSSLATIQFAILGQIVWHYALWYSSITIVATLLGQHLCDVYVRRTGRYSLITLSIAGVLFFSLIALAFVGTLQVMEDVKYGQQMWWSTARLCSGGRLGILDVDVVPAQAWPRDMPQIAL